MTAMRIISQDTGRRKNGSIRVPSSSKRGSIMRKVANPAAARRNKIPEERVSMDIFIFFMGMTLTLGPPAFNGCSAEERTYPH